MLTVNGAPLTDAQQTAVRDGQKALGLSASGGLLGPGAAPITAPGGLVAYISAYSDADQTLSSTPAAVNFTTTDPVARNITRSGAVFTVAVAGLYIFQVQPQITTSTSGGITTIWVRKNGVDVPASAARFSSTGSGDTSVIVLIAPLDLVAGDTFQFRASVNGGGSSLDATPAGGGIPLTPAVIVAVQGYAKPV
jgi:hypothetical protein